jgi:DNA-binding response OmpR family regulator
VEKIIFNLLSNAFKHSGKKEQILFEAKENKLNNELEIRVANSGIQLSADQLNQLFDKFYVASPNMEGVDKFGTGIGLAFTRQLVILLNGRITVTSDKGWITFTVYLPLEKQAPEHAVNNQISDKPSYLFKTITSYNEVIQRVSPVDNNKEAIIEHLLEQDKKNILVIEDDPHIRFLLNDILKDEYIVYEAEDGQKALELIGKLLPALVICDVMMPNMNGLELCNKMKNAPATCQVPFILLSAKSSEEHHMEGYEVGADAYIAKPFHTAHLKLRVRKLLEYQQKLHDLFKNDVVVDIINEPGIQNNDKVFLANLVKVIEENIDEPALTAAFLEKEFCLSKMQLYRKLKILTGMTPGEFIKHLRLKHASRLLTSTSFTVSEIFFRSGFNNESYFFREFKKRYNCAPNEYREKQTIPG